MSTCSYKTTTDTEIYDDYPYHIKYDSTSSNPSIQKSFLQCSESSTLHDSDSSATVIKHTPSPSIQSTTPKISNEITNFIDKLFSVFENKENINSDVLNFAFSFHNIFLNESEFTLLIKQLKYYDNNKHNNISKKTMMNFLNDNNLSIKLQKIKYKIIQKSNNNIVKNYRYVKIYRNNKVDEKDTEAETGSNELLFIKLIVKSFQKYILNELKTVTQSKQIIQNYLYCHEKNEKKAIKYGLLIMKDLIFSNQECIGFKDFELGLKYINIQFINEKEKKILKYIFNRLVLDKDEICDDVFVNQVMDWMVKYEYWFNKKKIEKILVRLNKKDELAYNL